MKYLILILAKLAIFIVCLFSFFLQYFNLAVILFLLFGVIDLILWPSGSALIFIATSGLIWGYLSKILIITYISIILLTIVMLFDFIQIISNRNQFKNFREILLQKGILNRIFKIYSNYNMKKISIFHH